MEREGGREGERGGGRGRGRRRGEGEREKDREKERERERMGNTSTFNEFILLYVSLPVNILSLLMFFQIPQKTISYNCVGAALCIG